VSSEGVVEGEVVAENADVAGAVRGNMTVGGRLVLKGSARVDGDIQVGRLVMEEGAVLNGLCRMSDGETIVRPVAVLVDGASENGR